MSSPGDNESTDDRDQALSYISDMTRELALLARRYRLDALCYLLDMARLEAENAASTSSASETNFANG